MTTTYVLVLALVGGCLGQFGLPEEEYVLNFDSPVYMCPEDAGTKFVDMSKIQVKLVDGAPVLSGTVNFLQELDHNTMLVLQVDKEVSGSGRFEMVLSHEICDLCGETQNEDSDYKDYLKYFKYPEQCPFEPQEYLIDDFTAETKDLPVNAENAGNYQAKVIIYHNNGDCESIEKTVLACIKIDFVIEPGK